MLTDGAATSFTTIDLSAYAPTTATSVMVPVFVNTSSGTGYAYVEVASAGTGTTSSYSKIATSRIDSAIAGDFQYACGEVLLTTAQQIAYYAFGTNAQARLRVTGWRF